MIIIRAHTYTHNRMLCSTYIPTCLLSCHSADFYDIFTHFHVSHARLEKQSRDRCIKQFSIYPFTCIQRYVGWNCVLNCFMLSSLYLVSLLFADLLSLHLVEFLMFFFYLLNLNAWSTILYYCVCALNKYKNASTIAPLFLIHAQLALRWQPKSDYGFHFADL